MPRYDAGMEGMVEVYIFETNSLLEQLDEILLSTEKSKVMGEEEINEIFRIMHTLKGSSAMMGLENITHLAHVTEDMFFILRENKNTTVDISKLYELVFEACDLFKAELETIQDNDSIPTDFSPLANKIKAYIEVLNGNVAPNEVEEVVSNTSNTETINNNQSVETPQNTTPAPKQIQPEASTSDMITVRVYFDDDCQMENLRALLLFYAIKDDCAFIETIPADIESNPETAKIIIEEGLVIKFIPFDNADVVLKAIEVALNVKSYEIIEEVKPVAQKEVVTPVQQQNTAKQAAPAVSSATKTDTIKKSENTTNTAQSSSPLKQSLISVNLKKLDQLLDMVGEIVITEAMVTSNPDLKGLKLENFSKASRQLRKLTDELQDVVMSIRMVPLSGVFNKMSRIVRDMNVKQNKSVELVFEGEDTEVDKTIIDNLNDPMMHMVRNAMDHGIETPEEYQESGKTEPSRITLSAYNASSEVVIIVADNGKGIDQAKVLAKAKANGILTKPEEDYTENEICNLIMAPGFSTNEAVTEYSGRGVGTDVVKKNIEKVGGSVNVFSKLGEGTSFVIKIPLSLAIVDAMEVSVGNSIFSIPTNIIKESFKLKEKQLIHDTEQGEMIMIRGECFPLIRINDFFGISDGYTSLNDGIIMLVESDGKSSCIFVDELIGEQQVVVKPFPAALNRFNVKKFGMSGCSVLGDGSITIILDINNIINNY